MLEEHLGGHNGLTHLDPGALSWFKSLGFKKFLDIGCGPGGMVELAENMGFDSYGIDGDYTVKRYKQEKFLIHDFTSGPVEITQVYDIGWSVEFVEHVHEQYIPNYMPAMQQCKHIVMTHALEGQPGYHHVNCQNPPYWINKLKSFGFTYDDKKTKKLRQVSKMGKKRKHRFIERTGLFFTNEKF